jgi:hypothetical protein
MYLRFVVPHRDVRTRAERGFFATAYMVKWRSLEAPAWIRDEVTRELNWFDENLDAPRKLGRTAGRFGPVWGLCWFRPEAREAINRARYVGWLLTDVGHPVAGLKRDDPGEIIWQDDCQLVAKPPRDLPRMFH